MTSRREAIEQYCGVVYDAAQGGPSFLSVWIESLSGKIRMRTLEQYSTMVLLMCCVQVVFVAFLFFFFFSTSLEF